MEKDRYSRGCGCGNWKQSIAGLNWYSMKNRIKKEIDKTTALMYRIRVLVEDAFSVKSSRMRMIRMPEKIAKPVNVVKNIRDAKANIFKF
jgi:hypothetical protein